MKNLAPAPPISWKRRTHFLVGLGLLLLSLNSSTLAQGRPIRVARVSLVEGEVSVQRSQDKPDQWSDATANIPLDENDQVYTGSNGRTEIQLTGGNLVRLSRNTNLKVTQFNNAIMQFALSIGTATFRIGNLDKRKLQTVDASAADNDQPIYFEVDSPVVAVTLLREGSYRINVADDGTTEVIVRRGAAEVFNKELGTIAVKEGRRVIVEGTDQSLYQIKRLDDPDDWDLWNDRRDQELFARAEYQSVRYVPAYIPGVYDLDHYGDWFEVPGYGWCWSPRSVAFGWAPYRYGSWRWYASWGWTWIGHEPWGWVPYHYGRWAYWGNRWCWVPRVSFGFSFGWSWAPAHVAFYGHGRGHRGGFPDGYRRGLNDRYSWVGWVPLAPGENGYGVSAPSAPVLVQRAGLLRNFNAPGGVTGVNGEAFDRTRVVVRNVERPSRSNDTRGTDITPVQPEEVKPKDVDAPAAVVRIPRSTTGRDLDGPVVVRRTPVPSQVDTSGAVGGSSSLRPSREGTQTQGTESVARPSRSGTPGSPATVDSESRPERPARATEFRPAERPVRLERSGDERPSRGESAPTREVTSPSSDQRVERPSRSVNPSRRDETPPARSVDPPSRSEAPQRIERPSQPERSQPAPERAQPAPERSQPAPERSQPAPERQSQPAPSRESSPPSRPGRP